MCFLESHLFLRFCGISCSFRPWEMALWNWSLISMTRRGTIGWITAGTGAYHVSCGGVTEYRLTLWPLMTLHCLMEVYVITINLWAWFRFVGGLWIKWVWLPMMTNDEWRDNQTLPLFIILFLFLFLLFPFLSLRVWPMTVKIMRAEEDHTHLCLAMPRLLVSNVKIPLLGKRRRVLGEWAGSRGGAKESCRQV